MIDFPICNRRVVDDGFVTAASVAAGIDMLFAAIYNPFGREVAHETARYSECNRNG